MSNGPPSSAELRARTPPSGTRCNVGEPTLSSSRSPPHGGSSSAPIAEALRETAHRRQQYQPQHQQRRTSRRSAGVGGAAGGLGAPPLVMMVIILVGSTLVASVYFAPRIHVALASGRPLRAGERFDAAIVLGHSLLESGHPSESLTERLEVAVQLLKAGRTNAVVCSGGVDEAKGGVAEALSMVDWLVRYGGLDLDVDVVSAPIGEGDAPHRHGGPKDPNVMERVEVLYHRHPAASAEGHDAAAAAAAAGGGYVPPEASDRAVVVNSDSAPGQPYASFLFGDDQWADIYVEDRSTSTRENALLTMPLVLGSRWKRVAIVTSPFHQLRAGLVFERALRDLTAQPEGAPGKAAAAPVEFVVMEAPYRPLHPLVDAWNGVREVAALCYYYYNGWL